jgi:hypothetical protein
MKFEKLLLAALTMTSLLGLGVGSAFADGAVKVECWGNCGTSTLGSICDKFASGSTPVAIACDDTADPGSGSAVPCGAAQTCTPFGTMIRSDQLSAYCGDGGGNDAIVTCRSGPISSGAVKMECWGNCNTVTPAQVCNSWTTKAPVAISCDETSQYGDTTSVACGGASCKVFSTLGSSELPVSAICADGGGNDVVVTCR